MTAAGPVTAAATEPGSSPRLGGGRAAAHRCRDCPAEVVPCPRRGACWCRGWRHAGTGLHFACRLGELPHVAGPGSAYLDLLEAIDGPDDDPYLVRNEW